MPEKFENRNQSKNQNQEENQRERESGVSEFVGATDEQEGSLRNFLKDKFISGGDREMIKGSEREKTEEERMLIREILSKMPNFIKKYGGRSLNIAESNIHILDPEKTDEDFKAQLKDSGGYIFGSEGVYLIDSGNRHKNALTIVHELIHFNSFQSAQLKDAKKRTFIDRRIGFEIHSKKDERFFSDVNEAITEELERRFENEYFGSFEAISDQVNKRNQVKEEMIKRGFPGARDISVVLSEDEEGYNCEHYGYEEERRKLDQLIDEIHQKNAGDFASREDVFVVFAKSFFSGKLLEAARLIEKTYGKGSFRKLGEETKRR